MSDRVSKCYFCGTEVKTGSTVYHVKKVSPTFTAIQCDACYEKDTGLQDSKAVLPEELYQQALKAIKAMSSDRSVSADKTKESLESLRDEIELLLEALGR